VVDGRAAVAADTAKMITANRLANLANLAGSSLSITLRRYVSERAL
jgi:hypothetical protein